MFHRKSSYSMLLVVLAALAALVYPLRSDIDATRPQAWRSSANPFSVNVSGTPAYIAMLGGMRGVVASLIWQKCDQLWHKGEYWAMVPLYNTITQLDPHWILIWETYGWHCAWNLNTYAINIDDKDRWMKYGIEVYRRGIAQNPTSWELYKEMAWLYTDRLREWDKALPWWEKARRQPGAPFYVDHMIAHIYEKTWQVDKAVEVWKRCLQRDPKDNVAKSAIDWWAVHHDDLNWKKTLQEREDIIRKSRGLPPFTNPFERRHRQGEEEHAGANTST